MRSRLLPLPKDPRWQHLFGLVLFLAALVAMRHLVVLFVCFVLITRGIGGLSTMFETRFHLHRHRTLASLLAFCTAAVTLSLLFAIRALRPFVLRAQTEWRDWFSALEANPALVRLRELTGVSGDHLVEVVRTHALDAAKYANETVHVLLYLLIGLIIAVMFLFEREELVHWRDGLAKDGIADTLLRWFGYVADAIIATARMQLVVALVNATLTFPVLMIIGLKHVGMLTVLILVSGLVPVVGNFVSGAVLCVVAYESKGAWAVGVFVGVTFVLHKVESYYLNPRLAAVHVKLPALVLVGSLILFEHFLGLAGLFLSFPALYVGSRILHEWEAEAGMADPQIADYSVPHE